MTQTDDTTYGIILRTRAFGGRLETNKHAVDADGTGTVTVYDTIAGYYTSCHSLSARDLGRVRAAARRVRAAARRATVGA